ncbi:MAG TPA: COX15/CtaA family protein, partial [Bacteroidota bacterium]|nr:COX15/CtaA family protein [Bacteroidota bacterium]
YLLPTPVSVAHATLAQSFFSVTILLALVTSRGWREAEAETLPVAARTRTFVLGAAGAVFLQLILGAWMRHSDAGLAIPDFPLSYGRLVPPAGAEGLSWINEQRTLWLDLPPVSAPQVWIHFAHRTGALLAGAAVLACGLHILRRYPADRRLREPAIVMMMLVIVQFLLGALTVWSGKGIQISTSHVATGALLFGTCVLVAARSFHHFAVPDSGPAFSVSPQPTGS